MFTVNSIWIHRLFVSDYLRMISKNAIELHMHNISRLLVSFFLLMQAFEFSIMGIFYFCISILDQTGLTETTKRLNTHIFCLNLKEYWNKNTSSISFICIGRSLILMNNILKEVSMDTIFIDFKNVLYTIQFLYSALNRFIIINLNHLNYLLLN